MPRLVERSLLSRRTITRPLLSTAARLLPSGLRPRSRLLVGTPETTVLSDVRDPSRTASAELLLVVEKKDSADLERWLVVELDATGNATDAFPAAGADAPAADASVFPAVVERNAGNRSVEEDDLVDDPEERTEERSDALVDALVDAPDVEDDPKDVLDVPGENLDEEEDEDDEEEEEEDKLLELTRSVVSFTILLASGWYCLAFYVCEPSPSPLSLLFYHSLWTRNVRVTGLSRDLPCNMKQLSLYSVCLFHMRLWTSPL